MKGVNVLLTPTPVVTIILVVPAMWAGVIQVIMASLSTSIDVAFNPSNVTTVAPVKEYKEVPIIMTEVPPSVLPDDGEISVITGGVI